MKTVLKILFVLSLSLIILGYLFKFYAFLNGNLFIGFGVLLFAFILMPLFIYYRYKDRVGDFIDSRMEKPADAEEN